MKLNYGGIKKNEKEKNQNLKTFEINQRRFNNLKINRISDGRAEIKSTWPNKIKKENSKPREKSK
jgi:hypothetical protein